MTLSDLSSIGSLISGVAVLVSLVYLSQQTRQNSKHTRALISQERSEIARGLLDTLSSNAALAETYARLTSGDHDIGPGQIVQYCYWMASSFYVWEDQFYQHREGLIDDRRHSSLVLGIRARLQSPETRAMWKMARLQVSPDFLAFMDGLMLEALAIPGAGFEENLAETWKSLAAAERSGANP